MTHPVEAVGCKLVLKSLAVEDPVLKRARQAGFALAKETEKDLERMQAGIDKGTVLDIGPSCSEHYISGIKVGDTVVFAKYAGKIVPALDNEDEKYLVINDEDVVCKYRSKHE